MQSPSRYRQYAQECERIARQGAPQHRAVPLEVAAPWVKEAAKVGKNRGVLLPAKIDEVDPPLGFMMIQAADLVGWRGDRTDQRWTFFLDAVQGILRGGSGLAAAEAPVRQAPRT